MLSTSKIMSFIDNNEGFSLYFFEGQKLIHDLAIIHDLKGKGFQFLRDSILGSQLLSVFLKDKENFGFYIDSNEPYFRFKIETNSGGYMRTLLMPQSFNDFPEKISGVYRMSKITAGAKDPYNTIIEVKEKTLEQIINQLFVESFQINGKIYLSDTSDQSVFIMKLPNKNVDKQESQDERLSIDEYWNKVKKTTLDIFKDSKFDQQKVENSFVNEGFVYLGSKDIQFKCSCSRERMVLGVSGLMKSTSKEDIFKGEKTIETKCDYCNTFYHITEDELITH